MSYEIHIPEDSQQGHFIATLAARQHLTPAQVVEQLIDQAAQREKPADLAPGHQEPPAELVARLRAQKAAKGEGPQPPLRTDNPEKIIGLFAEVPELVDSILEVVSNRSQRYAGRA